MGRAPCCEKMGLKKGPWTPEEDAILISHIQKHGHSNWRALPKQAGLLRCGKSCRLRWINYLRPDIKRGNFTLEEEETIIELHQTLGNRWSAIAAKLPGRTDNEIKNVWHTHLKKKLKQRQEYNNMRPGTVQTCEPTFINQSESKNSQFSTLPGLTESPKHEIMSPQRSFSDVSTATDNSVATAETNNFDVNKQEDMDSWEIFPVIDEDFWLEAEKSESCSMSSTNVSDVLQFEYKDPKIDDGMDFWYDLLVKSGGIEEFIIT